MNIDKKLLIGVGLLIGCLLFLVACFPPSEINLVDKLGASKVPVDLDLESRKDNILSENQVSEDIIQYQYKTDNVVESAKVYGKDEIIKKRTKNRRYYKLKETATSTNYLVQIYIGNQFYEDKEENKWYYIGNGTTTKKQYEKQIKNLSLFDRVFSNFAFAQDELEYSESGDGQVGHVNASATWGGARDASVGNEVNHTSATMYATVRRKTNPLYLVRRIVMPFDTSGFTGTVASGTVIVKASAITDSNSDPAYVALASTTVTDKSILYNKDFGSFNLNSNAKLSDTTYDLTGVSAGDRLRFSLNTLGLAQANLNATSTFAILQGKDLEDHDPINAENDALAVYQSDQTGTSDDPRLEIEYTEAGADTCTYTSGDWEVNYSDNCYITSDVYVTGTCVFYNDGAGSFGTQAKIECQNGCQFGEGFEVGLKAGSGQLKGCL